MHWVCKWWWVFSSRFLWGLLIQDLMKPKAIVIHFEGFSLPLQIRFIPEQHVIQIFSTDGANQSFDEGMGDRHAGKGFDLLWSTNSTPAVELQKNAATQLRKTDLKQVLWETGSGRKRPKSLIELVGRTGGEPVAR